MFNKKAQIGETVTWIVATIIIVIMLLFFIFGSSLLGQTKSVGKYREKLTSKETFEGDDLFLRKSLFSILSEKGSSNKILESKILELEKEGNFKLDYNETKSQIEGRIAKI